MPSTYNNNLRLEMIANGEQSGTWGSTTNTNLGTLLVEAITSTATVNLTSLSQAFTVANGATDESRCAAILLTSAIAGPFNVYAPSLAKLYVIRNDSGAQVTIYCNAGTVLSPSPAGAAFVIPNGKTVFIRANNDNGGNWEFRNAVDSFGATGLSTTSGGTGLTTYTTGDILYASAANTLSKLPIGANGEFLTITAGIPAWGSGGGGGVTSISASPPLNASASTGSVTISLAANYGDTLNPYASKTANFVLASPNGSAGVPTFRALVAADLPTVTVAKGGTNITSYTTGDILYASAANTLSKLPIGTNGQFLTITSGVPAWGSGGGGSGDVVGPSGATDNAIVRFNTATGKSIQNSVVTISDTGAATGFTTLNTSSTITGGGFLTNNLAYNFTATTSVFYNVNGFNFDYSASRILNVHTTGTDPGADNTRTLGASGIRWSVVYAATGTINTSDANTKQDIADLDDAEKRVAVRIKGLIKKFRLKDSVAEKGDAARIHVGVIAQEVQDAFTAEGLDATRYGMFCWDTWWEREEMTDYPHLTEQRLERVIHKTPVEGGVEKTRLGVRYDELLAFVIAAM